MSEKKILWVGIILIVWLLFEYGLWYQLKGSWRSIEASDESQFTDKEFKDIHGKKKSSNEMSVESGCLFMFVTFCSILFALIAIGFVIKL